MKFEPTDLPAEKLPAFYEQFCRDMAAVVEQMGSMRDGAVARAEAAQLPAKRQDQLAAVGALDACILLIAEAYKHATAAADSPTLVLELVWRQP